MGIGLAIGLVIDLGGLLGQAEGGSDTASDSSGGGESSFLSDIADAIGGTIDERGMIQIPIRNIPKAIKALWMLPVLLPSLAHAADHASGGRAWYQNFALYIGPIIDIGFIYFTIGACLGGFGCVAGGGGLKFGNFGIGVLFPFWKWW